MNTIPMATLLKVLSALKAAHARLLHPAAPDPYMDVLRAELDLEYFIGKFTDVEVTP